MEDDAASSSINAPAHDDESTWDEPFGEGMLSNAGGDQEEAGEWRSEVRPMDVRLAEQEDRLKASEDQLRVVRMKVAALGIHSAYTSQHAESIGTDIRTKSAAQRLSKSPTLVSTSVKEAPNDSGAIVSQQPEGLEQTLLQQPFGFGSEGVSLRTPKELLDLSASLYPYTPRSLQGVSDYPRFRSYENEQSPSTIAYINNEKNLAKESTKSSPTVAVDDAGYSEIVYKLRHALKDARMHRDAAARRAADAQKQLHKSIEENSALKFRNAELTAEVQRLRVESTGFVNDVERHKKAQHHLQLQLNEMVEAKASFDHQVLSQSATEHTNTSMKAVVHQAMKDLSAERERCKDLESQLSVMMNAAKAAKTASKTLRRRAYDAEDLNETLQRTVHELKLKLQKTKAEAANNQHFDSLLSKQNRPKGTALQQQLADALRAQELSLQESLLLHSSLESLPKT